MCDKCVAVHDIVASVQDGLECHDKEQLLSFQCPSAILAFGDSYTDTGELIQSFTGAQGFDAAERLPYGITYFGRPVDRNSDGRLIIDFLCQAFGLRLLNPYFENIAPDFRQAINFATATSRVRPEDLGAAPFYLGLQVNQAIRFYNRSLHAPPRALGNRFILSLGFFKLQHYL